MMPKKRYVPDDPETDDESSVDEMDVDENLDEKEISNSSQNEEEVPFLDTFYGLSSSSGTDRAQAAHDLLQHCLLGPNANSKDAAYAFKRLLNGLCSGRASARQGYASALTSYLKLAFQQGMINEIMGEYSAKKEQSRLVFVRNRLLETTDPAQAPVGKFGKKKGSEERDYCFGRIFGILSVIRSGLLDSSDDVEQVAIGYAQDLVELYGHKKWMREPATQGILALLTSCFSRRRENNELTTANKVVTQVLIPKLLLGDNESQERSVILSQYTPEQIAIAVHIQSYNVTFPFPLDQPILSSDNMEYMSGSLSSTSHVIHPRTHLVWDVVWSCLTADSDSSSHEGSDKKISQCVLCEHAPASSESGLDIVASLYRTVVIQSLLGGKTSNPTHDQRALALTLVKTFCGGVFKSLSAGASVLELDPEVLEKLILCPVVVQRLFLDVISAGGKSGSSNQHMLKPLALHVLESILPEDGERESRERRLAISRAFLRCNPRFDARTKTRTISSVLLLDETITDANDPDRFSMWTQYVDFLKRNILSGGEASNGVEDTEKEVRATCTSYQALGYVDLLYNAVKQILRIPTRTEDNNDIQEFQTRTTQEVLGFLMACAFFDCSDLKATTVTPQNTKKKKKKKKTNNCESEAVNVHPAVDAGLYVRDFLSRGNDDSRVTVPYEIRTTLSSRFYSLLADYLASVVPRRTLESGKSETTETIRDKDTRLLKILVHVCQGLASLEDGGALQLSTERDGDRSKQVASAKGSVYDFQSKARSMAEAAEEEKEDIAKSRYVLRSAQLMTVLYLNLLNCGKGEKFDDDDLEADDDDIAEMISDLSDVTKSILGQDVEEEYENPLLALAELSAGILSSSLCSGSQTRGASSKIVRETVKSMWTAGLSACSTLSSEGSSLVNDDVVSFLLNAIGAADDVEEDENQLNEDGDSEMDVDSDEEIVFDAEAAEALESSDDEEGGDTTKGEDSDKHVAESEEDDDVELDPAQLESLLLEDSDADLDSDNEGVLEHHAGADAALGQLIKLKQEARKAGRQAREKIEISNHLRCVVLIEAVVSWMNSTSASSKSVQKEVMLRTLVPLLSQRRLLDKALSSSVGVEKKGSSTDSEKRALLDRLTALLKTKICKLRMATFPSSNEDACEYASEVATRILNEARRSSDSGHSLCCSAAMIMTMRSIPGSQDAVAAASVYKDAVDEWSTKRTSRLNTTMIEDLIQQCQSLAQSVLPSPLVTATVQARSPFLRSEAYRLLAIMFATAKFYESESPPSLETMGVNALREVILPCTKSFNEALQNGDMQKTKRIREVLKAIEKVVAFSKETSRLSGDGELDIQLRKLVELLDSLKEQTESHSVKSACERISKELEMVTDSISAPTKVSKKSSTKKKKKKKRKKK